MDKKYALAIDSGSQGVRGCLIDAEGHVAATAIQTYHDYYSSSFGFVEAPPDMFWNNMVDVIRKLKKSHDDAFSNIIGISVSCQRDTTTFIDRKGKPLRDFISWMDRRTLKQAPAFDEPWSTAFRIAGKKDYVENFARTSHCNWLKANEPDNYDKAAYLIFLSTYLISKLTGHIIDSTADIAGHLPFNYKKKVWAGRHSVIGQVLRVDRQMLCPLAPPCTILGTISKEAAKETGLSQTIPVIGSGSDKSCETIGVGCVRDDIASISLGTQATVQTTTKKYIELIPFYPSLPSVEADAYHPEYTLYSGFWMVNWFIDNFMSEEKRQCVVTNTSIYDLLEEKLKAVPAGANGLLIQPFWGQDNFKENALGSMIGFTESHHKYHIYRAIIEGIGYALREGMEKIEKKTRKKIKTAALSGGGTNSPAVCQILADILGIEVYLTDSVDNTCLGAAMAVFKGLGVYPDLSEAGKKMIAVSHVYNPIPKNRDLYQDIYQHIYLKAYDRYTPLFKRLKHTFHS